MKFISLFGGIGGFDLALKRLGHEPVYYSDIDKYSTKIYNKNFGTKYDSSDITKVGVETIPAHELLCAGFPCQAFSIAGKRGGFSDTRGTLFFEIMRIARHHRTKYLLLENVKGLLSHDSGWTFATILNTLDECGYDAQWQVLNSKFFGVPQNRERVFIIANLREVSRPKIFPFTQDAETVSGVSGKEEVHPCIDANYYKGMSNQRKSIFSPTITTENAHGYGNHVTVGQTEAIAKCYDRKGFDSRTKGFRESEESPTLSKKMGTGGNNVPMINQPATVDLFHLYNGEERPVSSRVMDDGNSASIQGVQCINLLNENRLRRLTPVECERLQGFPDGWTEGVSDTQRYKQLGNSLTVNVVEEIMRRWNEA